MPRPRCIPPLQRQWSAYPGLPGIPPWLRPGSRWRCQAPGCRLTPPGCRRRRDCPSPPWRPKGRSLIYPPRWMRPPANRRNPPLHPRHPSSAPGFPAVPRKAGKCALPVPLPRWSLSRTPEPHWNRRVSSRKGPLPGGKSPGKAALWRPPPPSPAGKGTQWPAHWRKVPAPCRLRRLRRC